MQLDRYLKMWHSRTSLIKESKEMGRMSGDGEEDGDYVLCKEAIRDSFHSEGRTPELREELKIREGGAEIKKVVFMSIWDVMKSGPGNKGKKVHEQSCLECKEGRGDRGKKGRMGEDQKERSRILLKTSEEERRQDKELIKLCAMSIKEETFTFSKVSS